MQNFVMRTTKTDQAITKTYLYNFDPLKPHFYIVKLGFTGVYIIFLIFVQTHRLWYSLEPPRRDGSNEYPQSMFWAEIWKISEFFLSENFQFLEVKFSIYLNRRVFIMLSFVFAGRTCQNLRYVFTYATHNIMYDNLCTPTWVRSRTFVTPLFLVIAKWLTNTVVSSTLSTLSKIFSRRHFEIFSLFFS